MNIRYLRAALLGVIALALPLESSAFNETFTNGINRDLSQFAGDSGGADGINDVQIQGPAGECGNITKYLHLNSSARAFSSTAYASMSYAEAVGVSYSGTGPFCPSDGDLYYIKTGNNRFYKLRVNTNVSGGSNVDYAWLGTGLPTPPNSAFSVAETYDLFARFSDASTGNPSAWSWAFGDGNTSSSQNPRYRYGSAGTRTVTLTASNVGGPDPTPASTMVVVSERPSTLVAIGGTFDLDNNATADLQVVAGSCAPLSSHLETRNGSGAQLLGSDYRNITIGNIAGSPFTTTNFCADVDYLDGFMVKTGANNIYRAWMARNDSGGIRLEFALLQSGGPPPPTTAFTFSSYDLISEFVDTSSGSPASWAWDFGDSTNSTAQSPRHRYASAGSRSACLTASNVGGSGSQVCQTVTVNQVVSTVVGAGTGIDFNADTLIDLLVESAGGACNPIVNRLNPQNSAAFATLSKDYRNIVPADATTAVFSTGPFCVDVDYLAPFLVRTITGATYRAWTAHNDAGGVRIESALLTTIPVVLFVSGFE